MQQNILSHRPKSSWWTDCLFLTLIIGIVYFTLLGTRPLFVPDEGRYAEIAREMANMGDYITPHLNGIKYFEKPILYYWLSAIAFKTIGINLWSIRSINAILGLLGCLMTYLVGRKLFDRKTGLFAALILSSSMLYFVMAHMISLDLPVTFFLTGSLFAFLVGFYTPPGLTRRLYLWGAFASAALAVLTKGLIGIVFPMMIIVVWLALLKEWRAFKHLYLPSSLLIFVLIAAPWHLLVELKNPEFFYFYFVEQHFLRYTTANIGHYQPIWFFIPVLILGFFPWIVFLPQAILKIYLGRQRGINPRVLFFVLWAFLIFLFFSISKSKLIPYILPVFPALSILIGNYLANTKGGNQDRGIKAGYIGLLCLSAIFASLLYLLPLHFPMADQETARFYLFIAMMVLLGGTLIGCVYAFRNHTKVIFVIFITTACFLLACLAAIPAIDTRSIAPLATILNERLKHDDEVITFNQYYQDLPFYLQRTVSILNWRNELSYGMNHQSAHEWMLDDDGFFRRWRSNNRVFIIMGRKEFEQFKERNAQDHPILVGETKTNVIIKNRD